MKTKLTGLALALSTVFSGAAMAQTIQTAVDATFAPHAMPKLGGGIEGFNVDMAMEIGKRLKRPVNVEGTQFSGLIPGLNAKKYDWIAAPTTVTRAGRLGFPRCGTGARNGLSVSISRRSRGTHAATSRRSCALRKVRMPENEM